jgi:hypothetical protein
MMNSINWTSFERAGFGGYKKAALSWMFQLFPDAVIDYQNDSFLVSALLFNYCHWTICH